MDRGAGSAPPRSARRFINATVGVGLYPGESRRGSGVFVTMIGGGVRGPPRSGALLALRRDPHVLGKVGRAVEWSTG